MSYTMSPPFSVLLSKHRILVAEDNFLIAQELTEALERHGANVVGPVSTVTDALRLARESSALDGAVLDVNLGGQMIWPVADVLTSRGIQLVFVTAYASSTLKERYGRAEVIGKPTPAQSIVRLLATLQDPSTDNRSSKGFPKV